MWTQLVRTQTKPNANSASCLRPWLNCRFTHSVRIHITFNDGGDNYFKVKKFWKFRKAVCSAVLLQRQVCQVLISPCLSLQQKLASFTFEYTAAFSTSNYKSPFDWRIKDHFFLQRKIAPCLILKFIHFMVRNYSVPALKRGRRQQIA